MDTSEGDQEDPLSLHKYLYCAANPVNRFDPSGHDGDEVSLLAAGSISTGLAGASAAATVTAETATEISIIESEVAFQANLNQALLRTALGAGGRGGRRVCCGTSPAQLLKTRREP